MKIGLVSLYALLATTDPHSVPPENQKIFRPLPPLTNNDYSLTCKSLFSSGIT